MLEANPGARLALVGTGPESHLKELREQYKDFPVKFTGMLQVSLHFRGVSYRGRLLLNTSGVVQ